MMKVVSNVIELVIQMKKRGFAINDIADLTNFSENEIEKL